MMTKHTDPTMDDIIIVILAIISIIITELISCFTPSPKKSLQPSGTNPSTKKKVSSSSRQSATSRTHQREQSPALVTSTETSTESLGVTGFQPEVTTRPKTRRNSKAGTTSQATKTSRSGCSTASVSHQQMMK